MCTPDTRTSPSIQLFARESFVFACAYGFAVDRHQLARGHRQQAEAVRPCDKTLLEIALPACRLIAK
jgi:hypothetical protein